MDIYTEIDLPYVRKTIEAKLLRGEVGVIGTDTIYGISGNALKTSIVSRIQQIKNRYNPPSFIPHSLQWAKMLIAEEQHDLFDEHIMEYTGPFTTLWRFSGRKKLIPEELHSTGLVGLRFPDHWITKLAASTGIPLVTTPVNLHTKPYMTNLDNLDDNIRKSIDFFAFEGPLYGPPSTIVHCYNGTPFGFEERS
jgi:tRNA A37 threonylcarbamoyladenosine synthetase subunit TsaC/SUA5/YrdC